jgi:hypothetical protein
MFDYPYIVEMLLPLRTDGIGDKEKSDMFVERYYRILDLGMGVSVPDNPMGRPRFGFVETVEKLSLPVIPEKTVMNLNTFHTKLELDNLLRTAADLGIKYLLIIRGDGGPRLPKLDPAAIGGDKSVATTVDLLRYINNTYTGEFITGVAFNHYKPMPFETDRLEQKIASGGRFIVTQPVIGSEPDIHALFDADIPVVVEAWMSPNVDLLFRSVGRQKDNSVEAFDPVENLHVLHREYPGSCIYLSMLRFKQRWENVLPRFKTI